MAIEVANVLEVIGSIEGDIMLRDLNQDGAPELLRVRSRYARHWPPVRVVEELRLLGGDFRPTRPPTLLFASPFDLALLSP